jgi:Holliday junction resolvasome RuvABC endonuclease subunit
MRQLQADFKKDCVAYIKEHGKPRAVFVEAPVIYDKPSVLAMAQMFALVRIVLEEQRVPVFGTPVSTWKAKSSFKGGASKDHVAQLVQIRLPTLAQAVVDLKVPKVNWEDCFDSAGIALYGRGVLRKAAA